MIKKTKIVCTLGPSSDDKSTLEDMIVAGMNVARLNFSHGSYNHMKKLIENVRIAFKKTKRLVAILQDLQGHKIRLGELPGGGVQIKKNEIIVLSTATKVFKKRGKTSIFPIQYENFHKDVKEGDIILMDDGYFELKVKNKVNRELYCRVYNGGFLKSKKGVNCPNSSISAKTLTPKDKKDLIFGLKQGIDYVALSFVRSAKDIEELRALINRHGHPEVKIIAKIEAREAIERLDEIAQSTDGIMVARGDLGLEINPEQVPIVQKEILRLGMKYGKPVIIATQILESMIQNPRATRAEISDAAGAVFNYADALMLSGETSTGKYPVRAVRTLSNVAHATETELEKKPHLIPDKLFTHELPISDATCFNAAILAEELQARAIVIITKTGYTTTQLMKHRPRVPVITITYKESVARKLQVIWGINQIILSPKTMSFESTEPEKFRKLLKPFRKIEPGDKIVIVNAGKQNNFIRTVVY